MFYKNYMINYVSGGDTITIAIMDRDMTGFKNETRKDDEFILAHTKGFIDVPREEYENPYDYLEGGLFKGIIPPELIKEDIINYKKEQQMIKESILQNINFKILNKWDESSFKEFKYNRNFNLKEVLNILYKYNKLRILENLEPWDIEKEYKDYLIKYWGDWKID